MPHIYIYINIYIYILIYIYTYTYIYICIFGQALAGTPVGEFSSVSIDKLFAWFQWTKLQPSVLCLPRLGPPVQETVEAQISHGHGDELCSLTHFCH